MYLGTRQLRKMVPTANIYPKPKRVVIIGAGIYWLPHRMSARPVTNVAQDGQDSWQLRRRSYTIWLLVTTTY